MTPERKDVWASGDAYEPYVGRWSRPVAREFLAWLGLPPDLRWLDVGSGTGALSQAIPGNGAPRRGRGRRPERRLRRHTLARRLADPSSPARVADAQALRCARPEFNARRLGLVLNFVPPRARALAEMRRAVRAGWARWRSTSGTTRARCSS